MRTPLKQAVAGVLFSAAVGIAPSAHALLYNFDYTSTNQVYGDPVGFDLVLDVNTVDGICPTGCNIIGVTGTSPQFGTITTLMPPDSFGYNDNLFLNPAPHLSGFGFTFALPSGEQANIFFSDRYEAWATGPNYSAIFGGWGTALVTAVPEPQTYAMLLAGLSLLGLLARRRKPNQ